jgi:hypothetical protein
MSNHGNYYGSPEWQCKNNKMNIKLAEGLIEDYVSYFKKYPENDVLIYRTFGTFEEWTFGGLKKFIENYDGFDKGGVVKCSEVKPPKKQRSKGIYVIR